MGDSAFTIGYEIAGIIAGCTIVIGFVGGWVLKQSVAHSKLKSEHDALAKSHDDLVRRYDNDEATRREGRHEIYKKIDAVDTHLGSMAVDLAYIRGSIDARESQQ